MDYDLYLFSCLIKLYDTEFEEEAYDYQYDILPKLYEEFENSRFNIDTKSTYECIIAYLNYKYKPKTIISHGSEMLEFDTESDVIMFARKLFVEFEPIKTKLHIPVSYSDSIWYIDQYCYGYLVIQEHK